MKKIAQTVFLFFLVVMVTASMTLVAVAARPDNPGPPEGERAASNNASERGRAASGGSASQLQAAETFIYADDPGWVTDGEWKVEKYTLLPDPLTGEADLLVANDADATATYTIPTGYTKMQVASSTYWTCGIVEVYLDGALAKTVDLNSETTTWGTVIYTNPGQLDPSTTHTLTIRATGQGGPGVVEIDGVVYDLSYLHFVNVQYLRFW